jgi:hypothetical protein
VFDEAEIGEPSVLPQNSPFAAQHSAIGRGVRGNGQITLSPPLPYQVSLLRSSDLPHPCDIGGGGATRGILSGSGRHNKGGSPLVPGRIKGV